MNFKMLSDDSVRAMLDFRAAHTMSQKTLDKLCSFPENTIKKIELQTLSPTIDQLQALNRVLKTDLTLE
jgi:ribosome-binding protein aMBF1 (putative translation factor)